MRGAVSPEIAADIGGPATAARFDELSFLDLVTIFEMIGREDLRLRTGRRVSKVFRHLETEIGRRDAGLSEKLREIKRERDSIAHGNRVGKPLSNDLLTTRQFLGEVLNLIRT